CRCVFVALQSRSRHIAAADPPAESLGRAIGSTAGVWEHRLRGVLMSQSSPARSADRRSSAKRAAITAGIRLTLLNAFALECDGTPVALPMSAQRLLAFLALHPRPLLRPFVAGTLWPETTDERAH